MIRLAPASLALFLVFACGKGDDDSAAPTTPTGDTGTATGGKTKEQCLRAGKITMDMVYGWDAKTETTRPIVNTTSQLPVRSVFRVNLGGNDWDGDTSLPGAPDRWCFVEWVIDGRVDDGMSPTSILSLSEMELGQGTTNCGRESAPMASDQVEVCGRFFDDEDPVAVLTPMAWRFKFGGPIGSSVSGIPNAYRSAGYEDENFWGSTASSSFFNTIDTVTYGWKVDAYGNTLVDEYGASVKWTQEEVEGPDGLPDGLYFHVIPWIFPI